MLLCCKFERDRWSRRGASRQKLLEASGRVGAILTTVASCGCPQCRGQNEAADGRSKIGSYHLKSVFLHFLEKRPPSLITSPFQLFLDLLTHLDVYLQVGKLPHYFLPQCDLLETVGNDERHLARRVIREILSNPLNALLTSPTRPQQIYGEEVSPDDLAVAFHRVLAHPTREQCWKDLSELLTCVDGQRLRRQQKRYGRVASGLVDTLEKIKHISL